MIRLLDGAGRDLVDLGAEHAADEVAERRELAVLRALADDLRDRRLPRKLHVAHAIVDTVPSSGRELQAGAVDVRGLDVDAEALGEPEVLLLVLVVVGLVLQLGREVLDGVLRAEVGLLVGEDGVGGRVGAVEPVRRELRDLVEDLVREPLVDAVRGLAALDELDPLRHHLLLLLLAHGAAEEVRLAEGEPGEDLGHLHHLLLVDGDAVGLRQHGLEERVVVLDDLAAVLPLDVVRDEVHRARAVERVHGDDVLDPGGLQLSQPLLHPRRLELEDAGGLAAAEDLHRVVVVHRDLVEVDVDAVDGLDVGDGVGEDGAGTQARGCPS